MSYFTILTALGQPKIAAALLPEGSPLALSHVALGDGGGAAVTPTENRASLMGEVHRQPLAGVSPHPTNPRWIIAECVIPTDVGGWTIREVGLYDTDGDLVAYGNFPETYKPVLSEGSGKELIIRVHLEVSSASAVELKIDPSVVNASKDWVLQQFQQLELADRNRRARRYFSYQI